MAKLYLTIWKGKLTSSADLGNSYIARADQLGLEFHNNINLVLSPPRCHKNKTSLYFVNSISLVLT